jgi:ABC-type bacteriocin/lantibiotic exporter with double-glycine peptidase domain
MQILSQRDPRWAAQKLGKSVCTVGRYGCTITCLSMLSDWFKKFRSPWDLARELSYTIDGLVIWSSLPKVLPFKLEKRLYSKNDAEIVKSLKDPKKAVILQVDGYHWVLLLNKIGPLYWIADPWTGSKKFLNGSYKSITGSAHFITND